MFDNKISSNIYNKLTSIYNEYQPQIITTVIIIGILIFHCNSNNPPKEFLHYTIYIQLFTIGIVVPWVIKYQTKRKRIKELTKLLYFNQGLFNPTAGAQNWRYLFELNELNRGKSRIQIHNISLSPNVTIDGHRIFDIQNKEYNWHMKKHGSNYKGTNAVYESDGFGFKEVARSEKYMLDNFDFWFVNFVNLTMKNIHFKDCSLTSVRFYNCTLTDNHIDNANQNVGLDAKSQKKSFQNSENFTEMITTNSFKLNNSNH
jgi:predicted DNA-binding WGR domain protein